MLSKLPIKWQNFLKELDNSLEQETKLNCIGGFVIRALYNFQRETSDLDFIDCVPGEEYQKLYELGGKGSELFKKYKVYLDSVGVAQTPESYAERVSEIYPGDFRYLRLYALDIYDLALTKLERSSSVPHDLEDVLYLANTEGFDLEIFRQRYDEEMKVYVEDNPRHRNTFDYWMSIIEEERDRESKKTDIF
jgi:hypothetical protein